MAFQRNPLHDGPSPPGGVGKSKWQAMHWFTAPSQISAVEPASRLIPPPGRTRRRAVYAHKLRTKSVHGANVQINNFPTFFYLFNSTSRAPTFSSGNAVRPAGVSAKSCANCSIFTWVFNGDFTHLSPESHSHEFLIRPRYFRGREITIKILAAVDGGGGRNESKK